MFIFLHEITKKFKVIQFLWTIRNHSLVHYDNKSLFTCLLFHNTAVLGEGNTKVTPWVRIMWSLQKATRKVDFTEHFCRRCCGTMVSMLDSRLSDLGQRSRMLLIGIFTSTFVAFSCCSSSSLLLSSGLFGGKKLNYMCLW